MQKYRAEREQRCMKVNQYCMFSELLYFCRMNVTIQQYHHGAELVKSNLNGLWLCRVLKGSMRVLFEQKSYKLAAGTVFAVQEGATFRVDSVSAAADTTLAFVGNAAGTTVTNLVLDAANGGGTISGVNFAAEGTLEIVDWSNDNLGVEIPLGLGGCEGCANVANWTVVINGKVRKSIIRVTATGITVNNQGFSITFK